MSTFRTLGYMSVLSIVLISAAFALDSKPLESKALGEQTSRTKFQGAVAEDHQRVSGGWDELRAIAAPTQRNHSNVQVGATASPGTQVGSTYYDYQHNGSTGRQIDKIGDVLQVSYMRQNLPQIFPGRKVFWNKISVTGSPGPITLDNGEIIGVLPLGTPATPDGIEVGPSDQQGYTTLRVLPNGAAAVFYHALGSLGSWAAAVDSAAGAGNFKVTAAPQPGSILPGDELIWPHSCVDVVGTDTVLHVVAHGSSSEPADPDFYWRGVVNPTDHSVTWSTPVFIDNLTTINMVVEADPNSDTVAIVYLQSRNPSTQLDNDVAYVLSPDGGLTWGTPVNITNYFFFDPDRSYADVDAVFDEDGTLHITYNTLAWRVGTPQWTPADLWHWNSVRQTSRRIATAYWENTCSDQDSIQGGTWNLLLTKPNISVKPAGAGPGSGIADELIYTVWSQFGPTETDCATQADGVTLGGLINAEIWCSISSDNGNTWDRPTNLTGTETPDCAPGDCESEHWVSAAARADSGLYLSYVDDTHAGGIVQAPFGAWTLSPYMVLAVETREPVVSPRLVVEPVNSVTWTRPHWENLMDDMTGSPLGPTFYSIIISNFGNSQLDFAATAVDSGTGALTVNGSTAYASSLPAGTTTETLTVIFESLGYVNSHLSITSNDSATDPGQGGTPTIVRWSGGSPDDIYWDSMASGANGPVYAAGSFNGKPVIAGAFGWAGGVNVNGIASWNGASWDSLGGGVTWLAGEEAYAVTEYNGDLVVGGIFTRPATGPVSNIARWNGSSWDDMGGGLDSTVSALTTFGGDLVAAGSFTSAGGVPANYIARWNGSTWDSLGGGLNDKVSDLVVFDGNLVASGIFTTAGGNPANHMAKWNGTTWEPLGSGLGFSSDLAVYRGQLVSLSGLTLWEWNDPTWTPFAAATGGVLQSMAVYNGELVIGGALIQTVNSVAVSNVARWNGSTWRALGSGALGTVYALATHDTSLIVGGNFTTAGNRSISKVASWSTPITCFVSVTGDVNIDGVITSTDVIAMVNYVFKSGADPVPCEAAGDVDCNAAVNSSDIIFMVNHVFKSGPLPCDVCSLVPGTWACP